MRVKALVAGMALLAVALMPRLAAAQASCPITAPVTKASSIVAYTLTNNDECGAIVFSSLTPVAITVPSARTVAPGFQVLIFAPYGGATFSSSGTGSSINSPGVFGAVLAPGQSGLLYGDGSNYWLGPNFGFMGRTAAIGSPFTNYGNVVPGTTMSNSPVLQMPNGVMQVTNQASIQSALDPTMGGLCRWKNPQAYGDAAKTTSVTPAWWSILDPSGVARQVPLC